MLVQHRATFRDTLAPPLINLLRVLMRTPVGRMAHALARQLTASAQVDVGELAQLISFVITTHESESRDRSNSKAGAESATKKRLALD